MPVAETWWRAAPAAPQPSARWFGVFRRQLPLRHGTPGLVSIPQCRVDEPRGLTLPGAAANAATADGGLLLDRVGAVGMFSLALESAPASVSLAGVLPSSDVPDAPTIRSDTPENRLWKHLELVGERVPGEGSRISLARRLAYLLQPPADLLASAMGPLEWHGTFFPYQMDGIRALLSSNALLLADDMGLGKTIQAIGALRILALQRRVESALIVVPASLTTQWRQELRAWAPELRISTVQGLPAERAYQWDAPAHVYLTTYETLRSDLTNNTASPPRRRRWDVVILDEAQKIKNRATEVSRKCKLLPRRRAWVLTGTPLENTVDDLASLLEFVTPFSEGQTPVVLRPGDALLKKQNAVQLRRKKKDVLPQLPEKTTHPVIVSLTQSQREAYQRAEVEGVLELQQKGDEVRIENVLELILRLKQICNFCPTTGASSKLEDVRERLETLGSESHRALVFSQFIDGRFGVEAIIAGLKEFHPLGYTGTLSAPERQAVIQRFKAEPEHRALVLSLRAGGQGLNLQDASYVFHFDRWWNPAVERQAEDRSHRLGQEYPVHVYTYTTEGTVEERIDQILREKQMLFDDIVDDVSIDLQARLTAHDIFGLFGLNPPKATRPSTVGDSSADFESMNGLEFEAFVQNAMTRRGWAVATTPRTRDAGIDLIASRVADAGGEITLFIQCKNEVHACGVDLVRELNGVLPKLQTGTRGVVACPSGFTSDARSFARDRGILLWDRERLLELQASGRHPT